MHVKFSFFIVHVKEIRRVADKKKKDIRRVIVYKHFESVKSK